MAGSPDSWPEQTVRSCLSAEFSGEWGTDPGRLGPNATVFRSTDLDDWGRVDQRGGAQRWIAPAKLRAKELRPGDILLEASGGGPGKPVGRTALVRTLAATSATSNFFRTLRPDASRVQPAYLAWQLQRLYRSPAIWAVQQQTTGIINLKVEQYLQFKIPLPPLPEQRRITEVLDTLDEAIQKAERVIAKLKQMKQGLLHDMLTRGIDENGELRDPERYPEQFKESTLGLIPNDWAVAPFAAYASPNRPYLKTGPFGSSLKQEHWVAQGVPVITIGSLGEGEFYQSELLYVSEQTASALASYAVFDGDIVFSRVADVGRSVTISRAESGWIMSSNMMWISVDRARAVPAYVQANISANVQVRAQIRRMVNSAGRDVANAQIMNVLQLPWPTMGEQQRVVRVRSEVDARIASELVALSKLESLRRGLAEDLLTGRVRVTKLLDEASS